MDRAVGRLAATQCGVFSREQLVRLGVTRGSADHRLRTGRWQRVAPGVYRLAGVPPSWRSAVMAACLAWGEGAAASHRAAAALWRLSGFAPGPVELTVPSIRARTVAGVMVHRNRLDPVDVTQVDSIPVTTPARTLLDLASVASPPAVEEALDDALRQGLVSLPRLRWRLAEVGGRGRAGTRVLRALVEQRAPASPVPMSVFERRLLRELQRRALPPPLLQHQLRSGGRLVAVVDFAYPEARVAIEADGYRWHAGRARWDHDRSRRNRLTALGWRVIHVTWTDLAQRAAEVAETVRDALRAGAPSTGIV